MQFIFEMINYLYWLVFISMKLDLAHFIHMCTIVQASATAQQSAIWVVIFIW